MNRWTRGRVDLVVRRDGTDPTLDRSCGAFVTVAYDQDALARIVARIEGRGLPYRRMGLLLVLADADVLEAGGRCSA